MASTASKLDIKNSLLTRSECLGNSGIGLKEVCSQLIDDELKRGKKIQQLADSTYLSTVTIDRMWKLRETESGAAYKPNVDTCERILKSFGAAMHFDQVKIKPRYANKPKTDEA